MQLCVMGLLLYVLEGVGGKRFKNRLIAHHTRAEQAEEKHKTFWQQDHSIPTAIKDDCGKSRFVVCGNLYQKSAVASSKLIGSVMSPVFCLLKKDTTWWQKTHESYVTSMKAWMKRGKHLLQSLSIAVSCVTCLKSLLAPGCVISDRTFLREVLDWIPGNSKHKPSAVPAVAVFCFLNFPSSEVQINRSENHAT